MFNRSQAAHAPTVRIVKGRAVATYSHASRLSSTRGAPALSPTTKKFIPNKAFKVESVKWPSNGTSATTARQEENDLGGTLWESYREKRGWKV
jgi:hypothetical protein